MKHINNSYITRYTLQLFVITNMQNYHRLYELTREEKNDLKALQRYFCRLQNLQTTPNVGDIVIYEHNLKEYKKFFIDNYIIINNIKIKFNT